MGETMTVLNGGGANYLKSLAKLSLKSLTRILVGWTDILVWDFLPLHSH
jgi:hypothetical protein